MTTITIKTSLLRKIAPYVLFLFTVLSFFFTNPFLLGLFISLATLGFIFVNTTQLFLKERYLSYIEIFSSILLLVRLLMIYALGLFYQIIIVFILLNFIVFYIINFANVKARNTNVLGIEKEEEYDSRKRTNLRDEDELGFEEDNEIEKFLPDEDALEDEDQVLDEEYQEPLFEDQKEIEKPKPKQKKSKVNTPIKSLKRKK